MQAIIQNSGVSEYNGRAIFDAAKELGIITYGVGIVTFTYEFVGAEGIDFSIPSFFYGSTRMAEIAKRYHDGPGIYINDEFSVMGVVPVSGEPLRDDILNPNRWIIPIKRISDPSTLLEWIENPNVGNGNPLFVRPDSSLKLFAGHVINKKNYKDFFERNDFQSALATYGKEKMCISPYKEIWAEWRIFIVDGSVITGSLYKESGRLEMRPASKDILMIAQAASEKWMPDQTCVMDLALTKDGIKVVEFNSVNSSGLYESDAKKLLTALQDLIG